MKKFFKIFKVLISPATVQEVKTHRSNTQNHHHRLPYRTNRSFFLNQRFNNSNSFDESSKKKDFTNNKKENTITNYSLSRDGPLNTEVLFNFSNQFVQKKLQKYIFDEINNELDIDDQKRIIKSFIRKSTQNVDYLKKFLSSQDFEDYEKLIQSNLLKFVNKDFYEGLNFNEIIENYDILFNIQDKFLQKIDEQNGTAKEFDDLKETEENEKMYKMDKEFDDLKNQEKDIEGSINLDKEFDGLKEQGNTNNRKK